MNPWLDIQVKHEQNKDLLRNIEERSLVEAARAGKPRIFVLARIGRWMITAGHSLEARFRSQGHTTGIQRHLGGHHADTMESTINR